MVGKVTYLERAAEARRNVPEVIRILLAVSQRPAKDLASALGMSTGRLSERLSGKVRISSEEIAVCALFFNVEEGLLYRNPDSFREAVTGGAAHKQAIGGYFNPSSTADSSRAA